ncbi:MAG: hypothetical protein UX56_C0023G0008 [Candidatus Azambacteria bacterium GW2011_GWD2_46_48]|uniref:Uncharacterized protein n=1 Tax=Candidatus Azambacteria bacterium GW2011_GWD2_46_48 TaxID=1618623 RepID=A0A0G1T6D0_9BACT|nr:MAG: hypothetical protein UX56_C0023G0008 [Candidatus Azambacteria bacterium GW2011_GWD2_46_48]
MTQVGLDNTRDVPLLSAREVGHYQFNNNRKEKAEMEDKNRIDEIQIAGEF